MIRKLLQIAVLASLLIAVYSFIAYLCYLGLCGGGAAREIGKQYGSFYGYFWWIYLLIALGSLFVSRLFYHKNNIRAANYSLLIPLICLLPYWYVSIQVGLIESKFEKSKIEYYTPKAEDYICSPQKFIRLGDKGYYLFDVTKNTQVTTFYRNLSELNKALLTSKLNTQQCKNKSGKVITETLP